MFKLYDMAFKIGFGFNILIFIVLNIVNYNRAIEKWARSEFSGYTPIWGFPFYMAHWGTFSLNILIIVACGFIMGLIFRFVWQMMRKIDDNLQGWSGWKGMKDLIRNKPFIIGFGFGLLLVLIANIYTLRPESGAICFDCYETWGFPFAMHESGTILHLSNFICAGVVANFFLTIVFSFIVGLVFKFIWSKFTSKTLR